MLSAFTVSVLFLISYLIYHYQVGSVPFKGQGWIRTVYFTVLISHTVLAVTIVPLVLITETLPEKGLPFPDHMFAATFFVLTGFHGMHVTGGVIYNSCVLVACMRGRYEAKHVEIAGLYWHFVDLVWILIFTFVYLL